MKRARQTTNLDRDGRGDSAFTLLELLVVAGLVAAMSYFFLGGMGGGGRSAALQAGQASLSNLLVAARSRAAASGQATRLLVHHDSGSPFAHERYLRFIALEEFREGQWRTLQTVSLPRGIHVLPHETHIIAGLLPDPAVWRRTDGSRLHSSALFRPLVHRQVDAPVAESWAEIVFSAHGTTSTPGQLVVTAGRATGSSAAGNAPLVLDLPGMVRGCQLSVYGLAVPIEGREGF